MKNILIIILILFTNFIYSQNKLIDNRDSISYETKIVNDLVWMNQNLKYVSEKSFCNGNSKNCKTGNYYTYDDLENITPDNCRIPTVSEWIELIKEAFVQSKIELSEMIIDTTENGSLRIRGINLFKVKGFINIKPTSWIEGGEINKLYLKKKFSLATFWVVDDKHHNSLTHIHIKQKEIIIHAHEHNIIDKKEKQRMFSVRCVKE